MARPKKPSLKRLLEKWGPILRIQDWDIRVKYVHADKIRQAFSATEDDGIVFAYSDVSEELREADVYVCTPLDIDPRYVVDIEQTFVHELLHIVFWWCVNDPSDPNYRVMEQSIEATAKALIDRDRKGE